MQNNIFSCPKWVKNKRGLEEFFSELSEYCDKKVSLVFKDNIFQEPMEFFADFLQDFNIEFEKIIFQDVSFKEYVRFIDIQCDELEFSFVKFEKGGALKNRKGKFGLDIGKLVFRPFQVENDFVIDIGSYANDNGFLETEKIGRIQCIEFENHKEGKGEVYFIGINQHTTKADFRNRVLDNVSFQNCDLSNCYFLNAKVDNAEFRNCVFPEIRNHKSVNSLDSKTNNLMFIFFAVSVPFVLIILNNNFFYFNNPIFFFIFIFFVPFYILLGLFALNGIMHPIEYQISGILKGKKEKAINKIENFHHHFGVKDEDIINDELKKFKATNNLEEREHLQHSYFNLIELYRQLKANFDKSDFQTAGNFFYAQRYIEMISTTYKKSWTESWILNIHYMINGFGERFMRPLILLIATVIAFAWIPKLIIIPPSVKADWMNLPSAFTVNKDYIATTATPFFLLDGYDENRSLPLVISINKSKVIQVKGQETKEFYLDKKIDNNDTTTFYVPKLKDHWHIAFYYSLSHFNFPFLSENKQWFQEVSQRAIFWGWIERGLLWLFSAAFALAIFHRIKR